MTILARATMLALLESVVRRKRPRRRALAGAGRYRIGVRYAANDEGSAGKNPAGASHVLPNLAFGKQRVAKIALSL